jgi:dTDP-4-dehydrorhamnose 3,5-epimerase
VRYVGNENRGLLVIPAGVYHAVRNVGLDELGFINMPTRAYDHAEPDKHRLPADTTMIPYEI